MDSLSPPVALEHWNTWTTIPVNTVHSLLFYCLETLECLDHQFKQQWLVSLLVAQEHWNYWITITVKVMSYQGVGEKGIKSI